ncbi:hypothetical protein [Methanothermococcus okinawensis]|uniref:Uncharacterized protein n=1 Tax=Methanothermococcus okinawensis (strain DSM 14208 / JCM 11175 / IH1) TaxID=647113 RepID=F8ANT7_METOI|nr:hypothetical protein [Methanothermococcus okinawensis]AEH06290.1 hypothetical protein Metok_0300 [Methanothermococcus okinawensis IH1]
MTEEEIICARCGKPLKHPVWINGKPYGKTCAKNIDKPLKSRSSRAPARKAKRKNRKVDEHEGLDAFLAQPLVP